MPASENPGSTFDSFGDLLKYLRLRARLTQRELGLAVGYSEAHVSRIEKNQRVPSSPSIAALFIPALGLEEEPDLAGRLLDLAFRARGEQPSRASRRSEFGVSETVEPPPSPAGVPTNLPLQLTSFIGRDGEIREISRMLTSPASPVRLLTLSGPGGIGKTRLALHAAFQLLGFYPNGIWFIDLAPLRSPESLPQAVAATLGIAEGPGRRSITESLIETLRPKTVLLVLDNCEHLVGSVARLADDLLRACPQVQIMATSREPVNLRGEINFRVPPLSVPGREISARQAVMQHEAVELFVQRAQLASPSFVLTDDNASAVARVCRRLDGMPLAIELAAARIHLLSAREIEARLDDRFRLLTGGPATAPRQQTLMATIEWSYELLQEPERELFRRASVFSGGWTLEACNAVGGHPGGDTLDLLTGLVNKSLVVADRKPGSGTRFNQLETIREFAREKSRMTGDAAAAQQRHFEYFFDLARQARTFGPEKLTWLNRLEADHENLRAALAWALDVGPDSVSPDTHRVERALLIVGWLADYYFYRGHSMEAREWFDRLLAIDLPPSKARALGFQRAGFLTRSHGDFDKAIDLLKRGLAIAREISDDQRAGWALVDLGNCLRDVGRMDEVLPYLREALGLFEAVKDDQGLLNSLYMLAETHEQIGDFVRARGIWEQGLQIARRTEDKSHISWGMEGLAGMEFLEGRFDRSAQLHRESLHLKVEVMDKAALAYSFEGLAQAGAARGYYSIAATLWGAAAQLRTAMNHPLDPSRRHIYISLMSRCREKMGKGEYEEHFCRGRELPLAEAIDLALQAP